MKVYNAKVLVDNDKLDILFECDKEKNIKCTGYGNCRECNHTCDSRYWKSKELSEKYLKARKRIERIIKKDISDIEIIEHLSDEIDYYRNKIDRLEKQTEEEEVEIYAGDKLIKTITIRKY